LRVPRMCCLTSFEKSYFFFFATFFFATFLVAFFATFFLAAMSILPFGLQRAATENIAANECIELREIDVKKKMRPKVIFPPPCGRV